VWRLPGELAGFSKPPALFAGSKRGVRCCSGGTVAQVVTAFVLIDAEPARVAELAEEVAGVEGVAEAYSVAGQADIVAVVRVRQIEDLAEVVTRRLHGLAGVADTRTLVAFQSYSRKDLDEIWELGAD
jgi:DNA-binding Lrp family transcriptional regulator